MLDPARHLTTRPPRAWRFAVGAARWLLTDVFGWRVRARMPDTPPRPDQSLVVVFNHTSNIDAFVVADTVWRLLRHWCQPLAKAELFDLPVIGAIATHAGAIPVARTHDTGREAAYDAAVARLQVGGTILVAPESTVSHDGSLLPLRHGAARLALEAGVDVLVVTHFGAQRGFSPVVRVPERDAVVTMTMDVLAPWPDDDPSSLTGRIAATMLDRSSQLQASYPQAAPGERWWPPYSRPASPSAIARESLQRYQHSMTEAVAHARERMARLTGEHDVEQRITQARERGLAAAEELAARSRARAEELTGDARQRMEALGGQARLSIEDLATQARERAQALGERARRGEVEDDEVERP